MCNSFDLILNKTSLEVVCAVREGTTIRATFTFYLSPANCLDFASSAGLMAGQVNRLFGLAQTASLLGTIYNRETMTILLTSLIASLVHLRRFYVTCISFPSFRTFR